MTDPTILVAFVAGFVSFFAPCVLPLVPGFLAYLGGVFLDRGMPAKDVRRKTFLASVFFVLGFVSVFATIGILLNGVLAYANVDARAILARVGGAVMIFFGLYVMGLVRIAFLERTRRVSVHKRFSSQQITSFVFGAAFALGWTPCVGAALGAILGLVALVPAKAFLLLFAYGSGLAVPFLLVGAFAGTLERYFEKNFGWVRYVNILFGGVLVWFGMMAFTQNLSVCRDTLWGVFL